MKGFLMLNLRYFITLNSSIYGKIQEKRPSAQTRANMEGLARFPSQMGGFCG
jgi:hypothetical protein